MRIKEQKNLLKLMLVFFFLISSIYANASFDVPITYQGTVTTPGGSAPADGNYAMQFSLWNLESGGDPVTNRVWQETYTDADLAALIECRKCVTQPPKKEKKSARGASRNEMELRSENGSERFSVFMRISERFPENFSIGLKYHAQDGQTFNLIRCNGPHGGHHDIPHHFSFHIHRIAAEDINDGRLAERHATITDGYASYEEALMYFLKVIGVVNAEKFFPANALQPALFAIEGDQ